jgi:hypothetical protein
VGPKENRSSSFTLGDLPCFPANSRDADYTIARGILNCGSSDGVAQADRSQAVAMGRDKVPVDQTPIRQRGAHNKLWRNGQDRLSILSLPSQYVWCLLYQQADKHICLE